MNFEMNHKGEIEYSCIPCMYYSICVLRWSFIVAHSGLELAILQPLFPEYQEYRHELPCLTMWVLPQQEKETLQCLENLYL